VYPPHAHAPKPLTPEVQKAVDEFNSKIGQALADNLNRNVLAPDSPPAQEASARPAPARTEEGMKKNPVSIVIAASGFAAHKHRDQRRKGADASPYINHPIAVANVLANEAGITDPVILTAALLHDTIEDTDTTPKELETEFGPEIAAIVIEVTDDKSLPKLERKRLQIEHAAHLSTSAKLVKLADKICNVRDMRQSPPVDWSTERKTEYFTWAKTSRRSDARGITGT
jgi:guanosine-3',5'-bis(diphosphate) 3'-pyrophosphohydrolase